MGDVLYAGFIASRITFLFDGDEAGVATSAGLKKGVVSRCNMGEVEFRMSATNVKYEGKKVCRHLDIVTLNGNGNPDNAPPVPYIDGMAMPGLLKEPWKMSLATMPGPRASPRP